MYVVVALVALTIGLILGGVLGARSTEQGRPPVGPRQEVPTARPPVGPALAELVLDALGEGVVVVDRGDDVLLANPAARSLGALNGDRLSSEGLRRVAHEALDAAETRQVSLELPYGFLGRELVSVSVSAVPVGPVVAGRVDAVVLLVADMTETRRLEAVRRDFVANVSHELKTPVGALTLLAEAVQQASDDPEAVQRFSARMQHEGQRLGRLVGELIALSRVQGADALPELSPVSVQSLLTDAVDRTRLVADKAGITLATAVEPGLMVLGDESQLSTAVGNLADNAIAYSPGGTRVVLTGRLIPGTRAGEDWVEIVVADQGIGIADTDLDRIFERFYRVDPARSRATGGTGLGLAIVKHVVTNHGGSVEAWSSEGAGSTFTIRLRAAPSAARPGEPVVSTPLRSSDPRLTRGAR